MLLVVKQQGWTMSFPGTFVLTGSAYSLYGVLQIGGLPTALPFDSKGFTVTADYPDEFLHKEPIIEPPVQPYTTP